MKQSQNKTSDGILLSDWDSVKELAAEYANAMNNSVNNKIAAKLRTSLLQTLTRLSTKYGDRPSILATKADYLPSDQMRADMLERAFALAEEMSDYQNMTLISSSLAELYVEEMPNPTKGIEWVARLKEALLNWPDNTEQQTFERLRHSLNEIK